MTDATDNFNRADGGVGANWTTGFNALVVASNQVKASTASDQNSAWWNANSFNSDHYSQVTMASDTGSSDAGGPVCRHQSGANTFYLLYTTTDAFTYYEVTAGSFAALGATNAAPDPAVNDLIKLDLTGTTLTGTNNGTTINGGRTDATITGGAPGIHFFNTVNSFDDWLGGPIVAAAGKALSPFRRPRRFFTRPF